MKSYNMSVPNSQSDMDMGTWFAQAGPTESFRAHAPNHLLQENWEATPTIEPDPGVFAHAGPTPGFVYSR